MNVGLYPFETVYPLRRVADGTPTPFPTIYWLNDAKLLHGLSELERQNHVGKFEQLLAEDAELMAAYHADHAAYRETRWEMLTPGDRAIVEASPSLSRSFRGGIAGIANFDTVKCLHAQYAYHLAQHDTGGTTLGRRLEQLLAASTDKSV